MADRKKELLNSTRIRVDDVRTAYADQLLVAKAFEEGQTPKYSASFLFPPDHPVVDLIEAAEEAAMQAKWGDKANRPKKLRGVHTDPIIKVCADYPSMGKFPPGWCFVRASSTEQPGFVGPDGKPIAPQDLRGEVYSGRWCNGTFVMFAYERKTGSGISLALGNIQLTRHDERLGTPRPRASDEFDPLELPDDDNDDLDNDDDDLKPTPPRPTRRR